MFGVKQTNLVPYEPDPPLVRQKSDLTIGDRRTNEE